MKKIIAVISLSLMASTSAQAGPYADSLTRCMVDNTSRTEKMLFVKWMYTGISKHPEVASMSTITHGQAIRISQMTADMITDLMVRRCPNQTRQAFRYEGDQSFIAAFEMLGKVAMNELITNPSVNHYTGSLSQYIDEDEFKILE